MADRHDSERLRGFGDRQTDICYSRVAFATENGLSVLEGLTSKIFKVENLWFDTVFER